MQTDTLGITEAAKHLGVSRQAVHKAIRRGTLYAVQVYGQWRIPRTEVERRANERRAATPVEA